MKLSLKIVLLLFVLSAVGKVFAQGAEPRQIDEFAKWNSETIQARLDYATIELQKEPSSSLQFLLSRATNQYPGSAYGDFGLMRAYLLFRKVNPARLIATYCKAKEEQNTEVWLLPAGAAVKSCEPDKVDIARPLLFDSAFYPNEEMGTCCIVDNLGKAATAESMRGFAELLKTRADAKAYIISYGGTNIYWTSDARGRERTIRHLDTPAEIRAMSKAARRILRQSGIPPSQIVTRESGYRDSSAVIEMWIVPNGGTIPRSTPNFPKRKSKNN